MDLQSEWKFIDGRWYVFDGAGFMIKSWFKSNDDWYYLNKDDGTMLSNQWLKDNGKLYYFTDSGVMARSCYIKDKKLGLYYWVSEKGEWIKEYDTTKPNLKEYELIG